MRRAVTGRETSGHGGRVRVLPLAAAALAAAMAVLAPGPASADTAEAIHLGYAAPAGCPSEGVLVSAAGEMGASFREAAPGAPARTLDVVIERTARGFTGTLAVEGPGGERRVRSVPAGPCDHVVRTLGLFVAMALTTGEVALPAATPSPAAPEPPPPPPSEPLAAPPVESDRPDPKHDDGREPGGIAAMTFWTRYDGTGHDNRPQGGALLAVFDVEWARVGGIVAFASEDVNDPKYGTSTQKVLAMGQGTSLRLGAVASWGAPWSRESWVGLVAEAGVRGAIVNGAMWPLLSSTSNGVCDSSWADTGPLSCIQGAGTPRTWTFVSPYLGATGVLQILPRLPVRPFLGLGVVWAGDYRGNSYATASANLGLAWRTW